MLPVIIKAAIVDDFKRSLGSIKPLMPGFLNREKVSDFAGAYYCNEKFVFFCSRKFAIATIDLDTPVRSDTV